MTDIAAIKTEFNIHLGLLGAGARSAVDTLVGALGGEREAHSQTKTDLATAQAAIGQLKSRCEVAETRAAEQQHIVDTVRSLYGKSDSDVWMREPISKPANYEARMRDSIPILVFANLKGGVAKTTLAANVAAYFEQMKSERVLVIDLDFQGSLTSMLRTIPEAAGDSTNYGILKPNYSAIDVLAPQFRPDTLLSKTSQIRGSKLDSRYISCGQPFANHETALLLAWIIRDLNVDIRYLLCELLLSDEVQSNFSRVIIDAPPRTTTGFVNALCASTDLFIPTVLDQLSTDGVGTFLNDLAKLQPKICPMLKIRGVLGTMKRTKTEHKEESEERALELLKILLERHLGRTDVLWEDLIMPRMEAFARAAGVRVAYPDRAVKETIDLIGERITAKAKRRDRR